MARTPRDTAHHGVVMVVGSITVDVSTISPRLPQAGETVFGTDTFVALGGKGANQAVAAARAGASVRFVGAVGDDMFGPFVTDQLRLSDVNVDDVTVHEGATGLAHIRIDVHGQNNIVMVPKANSRLAPPLVEKAFARLEGRKGVLLTQFEIDTEAALAAIRAARRAGMPVVVDPAPWVDVPDSIWASVDVVTPNESEASSYTGIEVSDPETAVRAGRWFCEHGVNAAIITLGAQGAVLVTSTRHAVFPAVPVSAVDTTAAGDTFTGYLGSSLATGRTLDEAIPRAMHAAALSVTAQGASTSIPTHDEVSAFMRTGANP